MKQVWYALCHHAKAMKTAYRGLFRRGQIAVLLSAILAFGIITLLLSPSPRQGQAFGSAPRNLFVLTEGDYLNPLLSSAKTVTVLNCAAPQVGRFAGYDDFSTRVQIKDTPHVSRVTRFNGNLLSLLKIRFMLVEPTLATELPCYISESFWNKAFARKSDILGTPLKVHETTYRIVGVTRDSSGVLGATEIWLPISGRSSFGSAPCMTILGALNAGTDWRAAQTELVKCFAQFLQDQPYSEIPGAKLLPLETAIYFREATPMFAVTPLAKGAPFSEDLVTSHYQPAALPSNLGSCAASKPWSDWKTI